MWYRGFDLLVLEERTKSPELILYATSKVLGQTSRSTSSSSLSLWLSLNSSLSHHSPTQAHEYKSVAAGVGSALSWGLSPPLSHSFALSQLRPSLPLSVTDAHVYMGCGAEEEYEVGFSLMHLFSLRHLSLTSSLSHCVRG